MSPLLLPKRLIISRKGFDSTAGGCPSPIIDGVPVSLPIPEPNSRHSHGLRFSDLNATSSGLSIAKLASDLCKRNLAADLVHLDPDIRPEIRPHGVSSTIRVSLYGQSDGPQTELASVEPGDLFLFFGLFREVEQVDNVWRFCRSRRARHLLWGWLQVATQHTGSNIGALSEKKGYSHHPHVAAPNRINNALYEARERLTFLDIPGSGVFEVTSDARTFTEVGECPSRWKLPLFFREAKMTRFAFEKWTQEGNWMVPRQPRCRGCGAASFGQEFVVCTKDLDVEFSTWLERIFSGVAP